MKIIITLIILAAALAIAQWAKALDIDWEQRLREEEEDEL